MSNKRSHVFVSRIHPPVEKVLDILNPNFDVKMGKPPFDEETVIREISNADGVLVTGDCRITRKVLASSPKLKIVGRYGAGVEGTDLEGATQLGILVTRSPMNINSVAEGAILLILGSLRKITHVTNFARSGQWKPFGLKEDLHGRELSEKTVGIIGLGLVGSRVSEMLRCFNVNTIAYDPYVSKDLVEKIGVKIVDLPTLLKSSDVITIHCQLTPETRHLIGEQQFRLMKPEAVLVNTSRGAVVDENALQMALEKGYIAGAGLDVFDPEPPKPDSLFLKSDKVLATPHITGNTVESRERVNVRAAENLVDVLVRHKLPPRVCIANPAVLKTNMRIELK